MTQPASERLNITPCFDLELFMTTSQERRIGGALMDKALGLWRDWMPHLATLRLHADGRTFLLAQLDETVEEAVDRAWASSPASGFQFNALAQTLCMAAVHEALPEIVDAGCAPSPRPTPALKQALKAAGTPYAGDGPALSRRYAVLTPMPFKGGCEICSMRQNCPKAQGMGDHSLSVVLPGHE